MLFAQSRQPLALGITQWRCPGSAQQQAGKSAVSFLKYGKKFFSFYSGVLKKMPLLLQRWGCLLSILQGDLLSQSPSKCPSVSLTVGPRHGSELI